MILTLSVDDREIATVRDDEGIKGRKRRHRPGLIGIRDVLFQRLRPAFVLSATPSKRGVSVLYAFGKTFWQRGWQAPGGGTITPCAESSS